MANKNKFILMIIALMLIVIATTSALAAECSRSGNTMLITYSPNDLNVGEEFNLTYYDLFGGASQLATLNYPASLVNSGIDTVTLIDDGFGGGYWTWKMNSTAPGNHTIYINISYEEGGCNITRSIEIQSTLEAPNISLSYITIPGDLIANQNNVFSLIMNNTGIGTAYNVNGWSALRGVIDTFLYPTIEAGNSTTRDFNVRTDVCGLSTLESTVNYQDNFGFNYQPSHISTSVNVVGSDLEIAEFDVSDTEIKKGKTLEFDVAVENNARSETINATDVVVKIYRDNDLVETINLGDIERSSSASGSGSWKVTGKTGTVKIKAVVDSDNECSNWDNNEESIRIKVIKAEDDDEEEETWWPEPEEEEEEEEEPTTPIIPPTEPEEDFGAIAGVAIALEIIALALVIVYLVKRQKRRKFRKIKTKK